MGKGGERKAKKKKKKKKNKKQMVQKKRHIFYTINKNCLLMARNLPHIHT